MWDQVGEGGDDPDLMFHEAKGNPRAAYGADELRSRNHARHITPYPVSVFGDGRRPKQIAGHPRPDLRHRNVRSLGGKCAQLEWLRVSARSQIPDWQTFVCSATAQLPALTRY